MEDRIREHEVTWSHCISTQEAEWISSALHPRPKPESSKACLQGHIFLSKALLPKGFIIVPSSTVSWGSSVLIHVCMRILLQTKHTMWALHECQLMSLWSRVVNMPREGIWPIRSFKQWLPGGNEHIQYARKFAGCFICYLPLDVIRHIRGIIDISVLVVFMLLWSNTMAEHNLKKRLFIFP